MTEEEKSACRNGFVLAMYFVSLLILGVTWWKAAVIAAVVGIAYVLALGSVWVVRGGAVLLIVAFTAWVDLLPAPAQMRVLVAEQLDGARTWQCTKQASVGLQAQNPH